LKFGLFFFDADLDSRLDMLTAGGLSKVNQQGPVIPDLKRQRLLWNAGGVRERIFR
jgi:hypothetical protein